MALPESASGTENNGLEQNVNQRRHSGEKKKAKWCIKKFYGVPYCRAIDVEGGKKRRPLAKSKQTQPITRAGGPNGDKGPQASRLVRGDWPKECTKNANSSVFGLGTRGDVTIQEGKGLFRREASKRNQETRRREIRTPKKGEGEDSDQDLRNGPTGVGEPSPGLERKIEKLQRGPRELRVGGFRGLGKRL